jgi:hypothetical protein
MDLYLLDRIVVYSNFGRPSQVGRGDTPATPERHAPGAPNLDGEMEALSFQIFEPAH